MLSTDETEFLLRLAQMNEARQNPTVLCCCRYSDHDLPDRFTLSLAISDTGQASSGDRVLKNES